MTNLNDNAWNKLFDKYNILERINTDNIFQISASKIKEFREPRLMTKFDHFVNLPKIFQKNNLSILPITRGNYVISKFETYKKFKDNNDLPIEYIDFPENIQSIDFENITSESTAINCAYISGIFSDFLDVENLLPTVSGRMSSKTFDFNIKSLDNSKFTNITVNNSQIEIDGGYEEDNSLSLIEAKNSISSDFLIRQLYYPFRLWEGKIDKIVRPIFLVYSNGIFNLYEYKFEDLFNYNSLILIKQKRYSLEVKNISLEDIEKVLLTTKYINEPKIPFPQANSFERIINLLELLNTQTELTKDDITTTYDFDERQTDYYTNAGRYLGLIEKNNTNGKIKYLLSDQGELLFKTNYKQRQLALVKSILEHSVFSNTLSLYFKKAKSPTKSEIVNIMKKSNLYNITTDETFERRASTILKWVNWILSLQK